MSTLAKPPNQRQHARPSSIVLNQSTTVKTQHGLSQRQPVTGLRAKSPNENVPMPSYFSNRSYASEHSKRPSPETTRRSSAFYMRPDSKNGLTENSPNLNRWSQSTASSKRASSQFQRRSSFSQRLSESIGSYGGLSDPQAPTSNGVSNKRPRSPPTIPATATRVSPTSENPPPILPPIVTLSSLSKAVDAADTPSSLSAHTPATADLLSPPLNKSKDQDYFGSQWTGASSAKSASRSKATTPGASSRASPAPLQSPNSANVKVPESVYSPRVTTFPRQEQRRSSGHRRRRTSSVKSSGTTEGESSASDHRDIARKTRRRRAPSQKALLSKALAKANHAVVLDGKQNVEGAILAYGDACNLLRQVMVRSSGEDDRRKLEAVVSESS